MQPKQPNIEVVWRPLPGSQELALDSRAHVTLMDGSRGGGKSDVQLMHFARRVGLGYGRFWRGVLFDREYKALEDLISKTRRWFPEIWGNQARFLSSKSDYKWVWETGEELLFREFKDKSAYQKIHGQEFCLAVGQLVCTPNGDVPIERLSVGDLVMTPTGYKPISRIFPAKSKPCVEAFVYDANGSLVGSQLQSTTHQILSYPKESFGQSANECHKSPQACSLKLREYSAFRYLANALPRSRKGVEGDDRYSSSHHFSNASKPPLLFDGLLNKYRQFFLASDSLFQVLGFQPCASQGSQALLASAYQCAETFGASFRETRLAPSLRLASIRAVQRLFGILSLSDDKKRQKPIRYQDDPSPAVRSRQNSRDRLNALSGLAHILESFRSSLFGLVRNAPSPYDSERIRKALGSSNDYWIDSCRYDEQVHGDRESDRSVALLRPDALRQSLGRSQKDVWAIEGKHSHPSESVYRHPYTGKPVQSVSPLDRGEVEFVPCGNLLTIDIEIVDDACYITPTGLVNKNCWIGWNELTKWPTSECFDLAMSVNRSSFTPEKDNPDLPPIPLTVFATTNPSGIGHNWVRRRFVDPAPPGKIVRQETEIFNPATKQNEIVTKKQVRIFSSYKENPYLSADYIASLKNNPDENLRRAWLNGDWDIVAGGAFDDIWKRSVHVLPRFKVPKTWRIDRSFDWGSSHPFSVGWWAEANGEEVHLPDGRLFAPPPGTLIRIAEWYGSDEPGTNTGKKMSAPDVAEGIKFREEFLRENWVDSEIWPGPADNQIRNVNEQGVDTIEKKMADKGVRWTSSDKSPGSRINGLQLARDRLEASLRGEGAGLYVMDNCRAFISLVPTLPRDEVKIDDIDTKAEDHIWDETRYRVLKGANRMATKIAVAFPR